jgi:G:T/U-mismatch repair DNA glycosylase
MSTSAADSTVQLPDLLAKDLNVVFCGINPALSAARAGHHFSSGSNRFWRVLHLAGFTPHLIRPEDDRTILDYGFGLTAAVERPTIRADELARHEFQAAALHLEKKVRRYRARYLAFLGKPPLQPSSGKMLSDGDGSPWSSVGRWFGCCPTPAVSIEHSPWMLLSLPIVSYSSHHLKRTARKRDAIRADHRPNPD